MRSRLHEFSDPTGRRATVVVVTFTRPRNLAGYRRRFAAPLTVVADEQRTLYSALALPRASVWTVYRWQTIRRYAQLIRAGNRVEPTQEDTRQLGGNAVIDADGRLAWRYKGAGPDDRPTVDQLLAAVDQANR